jgi:hypothetical protein
LDRGHHVLVRGEAVRIFPGDLPVSDPHRELASRSFNQD